MKTKIYLLTILTTALASGCVTKHTNDSNLEIEDTISGAFRGVASIAETQSNDVKLYLYFARNSQDENELHRLLIGDQSHDELQSLAKNYGIEVRLLKLKAAEEKTFDFKLPYVAKTVFINFSAQENGLSSYRYNTIPGNRFKTTLTLRENQLVAEQTQF